MVASMSLRIAFIYSLSFDAARVRAATVEEVEG